ncbi:MAG: hypothetical protein PHG16_07070 [Lachnospiraceae bacterium]|nr:hypothetical protein [Lachnospiraceae bacterium]
MNANKMRILVTHVNPYDMVNDNKEVVKGCTVSFFFFNDGKTFEPSYASDGTLGYQRAKRSLPFEDRAQFYTVPGVYQGLFEMNIGSDGKPVIQLVGIDGFLGEIKPLELVAAEKKS